MTTGDWQQLVIAAISLVFLVAAGLVLEHVAHVTSQRLMLEHPGRSHKEAKSTRAILTTRRSLSRAAFFVQMIATVVAASLLTSLMQERAFSWLFLLLVIVCYITFGRTLPKVIYDKRFSVKAEDRFLSIGRFFAAILTPLVWLEEKLEAFFRLIITGESASRDAIATEDEINPPGSHDDGVIGEIERQMIDGILSLEERTVRDIMVTRLDIIALERRVSARELIDTITRAGHSRIPVYRDNLDNVLGVLYVKDLLPFVIGNTNRIPLLDLIRPAFVVPESKKLPELFTELKRTRIHMAIVADEYGGTAGLVTIEDILEEIVGEIQDEYDSEAPLMEQLSDDVILADGRLDMDDLEESLGLEFEREDDFGTLGGFVHKHLGRIAVKGDTFEAEGIRVEILEIERHRVRKMRITRLGPEPEPVEEPHERRRRRSDSDDAPHHPEPDGESA